MNFSFASTLMISSFVGVTATSSVDRDLELDICTQVFPLNTNGSLADLVPASDLITPLPSCEDPSVQQCASLLLGSGYNITDFDNYPLWYTESSYVHLAEGGVYTGIEGITEYLKFGTDSGPYGHVSVNPGTRIPPIALSAGTECSVGFIVDFSLDLENPDTTSLPNEDTILTKGGSMTFTIFNSILYDLADTFKIKAARLYSPEGFSGELADKFATDEMAEFLCDTMRTKCPDVWEHNILSQSKCKRKIRKLPTVDGKASKAAKSRMKANAGKAKSKNVFDNGLTHGWKANSLACRVLHAQFVAEGNSNHCPHISFKPMEDVNGNIKCQTDDGIDNIMTEDELFLHGHLGPIFFGYDGFTNTETEDEAGEEVLE